MEHSFTFSACRGVQGGRLYYMALIPFGCLKRMLAIDNNAWVLERSQRDINPNRAKALADYITSNENWIIPSLAGTVSVTPEWTEYQSDVGSISIRMDAEIKLFDGQHRASGILQAIERRDDLRGSTVPVQLFVDMSLAQRQQAFADINMNAKTVSKGLSMAYDHRDNIAQAIAEAAATVPAWNMRIDWQKASCAGDNPNMFPFKAIVEAFHIYMGTNKRNQPTADQITYAAKFFTAVSPAANWMPTIKSEDMNMAEQRDSWITYHVVGLKALAMWGLMVINAGVDMDEACERLYQHRDELSRSNVRKWEGKCMSYEEKMRCTKDAFIDTAKELCKMTDISVPNHYTWL